MSERDQYYGYGEDSIVDLAEALKMQTERLSEAKSCAAEIPEAERHIEAIKRRMFDLLTNEQPQDDSTEPEVLIDESAEPVALSEPIQSMTDFSGFDYGATPNGYAPAAPETD